MIVGMPNEFWQKIFEGVTIVGCMYLFSVVYPNKLLKYGSYFDRWLLTSLITLSVICFFEKNKYIREYFGISNEFFSSLVVALLTGVFTYIANVLFLQYRKKQKELCELKAYYSYVNMHMTKINLLVDFSKRLSRPFKFEKKDCISLLNLLSVDYDIKNLKNFAGGLGLDNLFTFVLELEHARRNQVDHLENFLNKEETELYDANDDSISFFFLVNNLYIVHNLIENILLSRYGCETPVIYKDEEQKIYSMAQDIIEIQLGEKCRDIGKREDELKGKINAVKQKISELKDLDKRDTKEILGDFVKIKQDVQRLSEEINEQQGKIEDLDRVVTREECAVNINIKGLYN